MHRKETCSQLCYEILPLLATECQQCNEEIYTSELSQPPLTERDIQIEAISVLILSTYSQPQNTDGSSVLTTDMICLSGLVLVLSLPSSFICVLWDLCCPLLFSCVFVLLLSQLLPPHWLCIASVSWALPSVSGSFSALLFSPDPFPSTSSASFHLQLNPSPPLLV